MFLNNNEDLQCAVEMCDQYQSDNHETNDKLNTLINF